MNSDQARQRAERHFRKDECSQDGRKAMVEYECQALATREKIARLKMLRLAKGASRREHSGDRLPGHPTTCGRTK